MNLFERMLGIKTTTAASSTKKGQIAGHTYILTVSSVFLAIREVTGTGFLENKRKTKTKVVNSIETLTAVYVI